MTDRAAIQGTFAEIRMVKTRSVVQMVIEIPIEHGEQIIKAFGFPRPGEEVPVAVARLVPEKAQHAPAAPETPRNTFYVKQAGRMCNDPAFQDFLYRRYPAAWTKEHDATGNNNDVVAAVIVRAVCGVDSRKEIGDNEAGHLWRNLVGAFEEWAGQTAEQR